MDTTPRNLSPTPSPREFAPENLLQLTGSSKQVEWATRIRAEMAKRFPLGPAADISEARFWIDYRNIDSPSELADRAASYLGEPHFESPFTHTFPRYGRDDARAALDGLERLLPSPGVVVLDLETTGLKKTDRICEVAAVRWPSREVVIETLVRPPDGWRARLPRPMAWLVGWAGRSVTDVSRIPRKDLQHAPPFDAIADQLLPWASECHLVSWNHQFDMPALRRELDAAGCRAPSLRATCAMRLATAWLELDHWPSLEEATRMLGINNGEFGQAHRAMADVLATCAVLDAMRNAGSEAS